MPKDKKTQNKKESKKKKIQAQNKKKKQKSKKQVSSLKNKQEDIELNLGIEEESIKKKKEKNKKLSKKQEIAKKKRKKVFKVVKYIMLFLILIGIGIYFMLSPFFNIKEITTTGNQKVKTEEIVSLSGIVLEENTFKIQSKKVEEAIKQNAYIDKVNIKRKLPSAIEIEVIERTPTFMITFANAYVYINNQGYLLEVSKNAIKVPIITGFLTAEEDIHVGNRLCSEDLQRLEHVIQIMKSAQSNEIANLITKINISDKQDYVLELSSEKKTVHVGDSSNLSTKMLYIVSILEENKKIEGEIFVNTDLNTKGAIFRKKI